MIKFITSFILYLGFLPILPDCNKNAYTENDINFISVKGKAVLLGSQIKLLDNNFKFIKDISSLNGTLAEIVAISENYQKQNPKDDYCQSFKYVKIKVNNLEGIIDGRKVYELIKHDQNKTFSFKAGKIVFNATRHLGVGVSDENGLTGCAIHTPVWFTDESSHFSGFVMMMKNKYYNSDYPYFELKDDDGSGDSLIKAEKRDNKYYLFIKRVYQEGGANLLVSIYRTNEGKFVAEILKSENFREN